MGFSKWKCKFGKWHRIDDECKCGEDHELALRTDEELAVDEWNEGQRRRKKTGVLFAPPDEEVPF